MTADSDTSDLLARYFQLIANFMKEHCIDEFSSIPFEMIFY